MSNGKKKPAQKKPAGGATRATRPGTDEAKAAAPGDATEGVKTTKERSPEAKKAAVKSTGTTREDRRAALRAQQLKQQQIARRNKQLKVAALVLAGIVLAAVIGKLIWDNTRPKATVAPINQTADQTGIVVAPGKAKAGVKNVTLYEDFQCPWCKVFDGYYSQTLTDLAKSGDINWEVHMVTFLDGKNKSSEDAARAAACAGSIDGDKYMSYFSTVFANQPATEGAGYTDDQLKSTFAQQAGLTGDSLQKFQSCYSQGSTLGWVQNADSKNQKAMAAATPKGAVSTPTLLVNGKYQDLTQLLQKQDIDGLKALIDQAK